MNDHIYLPGFDYSLPQELIKPVVLKDLKQRIEYYKQALTKSLTAQRDARNKGDEFMVAVIEQDRHNYKDEKLRLEKKLAWLSRDRQPGEDDWEKKKRHAKAVPITNLLKFDRGGRTLCIWHTDHHPSLKYYPKTNTVHCFACQSGGDAIDVQMQLKQLDFREAINSLI